MGDYDQLLLPVFLNAVFVAMATYLIVRLLGFTHRKYVDRKEQVRSQLFLAAFSALLIVPSIYILSDVLQKLGDKQEITTFFETNFPEALWEIEENRQNDSLEARLFLFGEVQPDSITYFEKQFHALGTRADIDIVATTIRRSEINVDQVKESMKKEFLTLLEADKRIESQKDSRIKKLENTLDSLNSDQYLFQHLKGELKVLFPGVEAFSFARAMETNFDTTIQNVPTLLVDWKSNVGSRTRRYQEGQMRDFLMVRADLDTLVVIEK
jgi:hypothetical protein